ncbi:hypothetical protein MEO41_28295, partial [Dolichospermum sp. ST_sed4]|nr:hypothetical protein [Dolichospermum sp. ST_sed4]
GCTDGRYGYFFPFTSASGVYSGYIARVDLNDFSTVSYINLSTVLTGLEGFSGGFCTGNYLYCCPQRDATGAYNGKIAKIDLANFTTGGVTVLNLASVQSNLQGFSGACTDGKYGYFMPYRDDAGLYHGRLISSTS